MADSPMDPSLAKRFRSGRACVDFAHTASTPYLTEPELVDDAPSLRQWLTHILELPDVTVTSRDVPRALALRTSIWELVHARIEGRGFAAADVDTLNAFASAAPPVPRLTPAGPAAPAGVSAPAALSVIARDTIDLLTGPFAHRIRACAAPGCTLLFVDASRPGTRRWCSMQRCGNLTKVRTYRSMNG